MRGRAPSASPEATTAEDRGTDAIAYDVKKSRKRFQQKLAMLQETLAKKRRDRSMSSCASRTEDGDSTARELIQRTTTTSEPRAVAQQRSASASHSDPSADDRGWYRLSPSPTTSAFHHSSLSTERPAVPLRAASLPRSIAGTAQRQPSLDAVFSSECSPPAIGRVNPRALMEEDEAGFLETGFMTDPRRTRSKSVGNDNHNNNAPAAMEYSCDARLPRGASMEMRGRRSQSPPVQHANAASQWSQQDVGASSSPHGTLTSTMRRSLDGSTQDERRGPHSSDATPPRPMGGGTVVQMEDYPIPVASRKPPPSEAALHPNHRQGSVSDRPLERPSLATRLVAPQSVERQRSNSASRSTELAEMHCSASEPHHSDARRISTRPNDVPHDHTIGAARSTRLPQPVFRLRPATAGGLEDENRRLVASVRRQHEMREALEHKKSVEASQRLAARRLEAETRHQQRLAARKQQKPKPKKSTLGLVDARRFHGSQRSQSAHSTQVSVSPRPSIYLSVLDEGVHVANDQADFESQRRRGRSMSWNSRGQHSVSPARSISPQQHTHPFGGVMQRGENSRQRGGDAPPHSMQRRSTSAASADRMADMYAQRAEGSRTAAVTQRQGTPATRSASATRPGTRRLTAPRISRSEDTDAQPIPLHSAPLQGPHTTATHASVGCHSRLIPPSESPEHHQRVDPPRAPSAPQTIERSAVMQRDHSASRQSVGVASFLSPQQKGGPRGQLGSREGHGDALAASPPLYLSPESLRAHNQLLVGRRKSRSTDNGTVDIQQSEQQASLSVGGAGVVRPEAWPPSTRYVGDRSSLQEGMGITSRDINVHPQVGSRDWPPRVGGMPGKQTSRFSLRDLYGEPRNHPRPDMPPGQPTQDAWPRVAPILSATPPRSNNRGAAPSSGGGTAEADEMMQRIAAMRALMAGM